MILHLLGNSLISYDTSVPFLWFSWFSSRLLSCLHTHTHTHTHTHYLLPYSLLTVFITISPCPRVNSVKARISVLFTDVFKYLEDSKQLAWSKPALHTLLNSYIILLGKHQCFHVSYNFVSWKWKKFAGLNCVSFCFVCSLKVR